MSQSLKPTKDKFIRAVTRTKADQYLSIAIPTKLSRKLNLNHNSYVSIYMDKENKLIFERVDV